MKRTLFLVLMVLVDWNAFGITHITKTIKPSGGDYSDLQTAIAANKQNLVGNDAYISFVIDSAFASAFSTNVVVNGYRCDMTTHYVEIYVAGTRTGKWNTGRARLITTNNYGNALQIDSGYVKVYGLQIQQNSAYGDAVVLNNLGTGVTAKYEFHDNVIYSSQYGLYIEASGSTNTYLSIYNNIIVNCPYGLIMNAYVTVTGFIANNTVAQSTTNAIAANGYGYASFLIKNNIASGSGVNYAFTQSTPTTAKNISADATSPDVGFRSHKPWFVDSANATALSRDFHLNASDTAAIAHADTAGLYPTFTTDIDGQTRSPITGWDIGADEYVSGCTAPTISYSQNPKCTVNVAFSIDPTLGGGTTDSVVAASLPAGLSMTKTGANKGRISGTPTTATAKAGYLITAYGCSNATAYDTITVIAAPAGSATKYYIDYATGADANNGTSTATPWKHCPGDSAFTGTFTLDATNGDTVIFKGGVTYSGKILLNYSGASATHPFLYDGNSSGTWGTGRAIIDAGNLWQQCFYDNGNARNYVYINNFDCRNVKQQGSAWYTRAIYFRAANTGTRISNCYPHKLGNWSTTNASWGQDSMCGIGIALYQPTNARIVHNTFDTVAVGIELLGGIGCLIDSNDISSAYWGIELCGDGGPTYNDTIRRNTIHDLYMFDATGTGAPYWQGKLSGQDPHTDFVFLRQGSGTRPARNVIEQNLFYNNYDFGSTVGGTAMVFLSFSDSNTIRNNVFINPHSYYVLEPGYGSAQNLFYNNTVYAPRANCGAVFAYPPSTGQPAYGNKFVNNIFYTPKILEWDAGNETGWQLDYNYYYSSNESQAWHKTGGSYYTYSQWKTYSSQDAHSLFSNDSNNLKFVSTTGYPTNCTSMNLNLQATSPARNAGTTIATFNKDYRDTVRPQGVAWDIGAYEYNAASAIPQYTLTMAAGTGGTVTPVTGAVDSGAVTTITATPNARYSFWKWTRSTINASIADSSINPSTVALKANATITGNFVYPDSIKSCYPNRIRMDSLSTATTRLVTVKVHGAQKPTATSIIWFGSVSLGQNKSYTDTTVVGTLLKYPAMPSGLYRVFVRDASWPVNSDTLINGCTALNPGIKITNPK